MAGLIPQGFLQFLDANGNPLVGGTVGYFDPASPGTPKPIFSDPNGTIAVSNPVTLDSAGRPATGGSEVGIWGTGQYLMTVRDFNGALQWTALTQAPLALSDISGLQSQITAETNARIAADAAEANARAAADTVLQTAINSEATTRANADTAETNARIAADTGLQNQINAITPGGGGSTGVLNLMAGSAITDLSGHVRVTFSTPFPTAVNAFVVTIIGGSVPTNAVSYQVTADAAGADVFMFLVNETLANVSIQFYWIAAGH